MQKFNTIIFDFDGTLFDSQKGILKAVRYALEYFKIETPDDEILKSFIGPPLTLSFQKNFNLSKDDVKIAIVKLREYYGDKGIFESQPYKGIKELLEALQQEYNVAIATAKPTVYTRQILEKNEYHHFFKSVRGSSLHGELFPKEKTIGEVLEDFRISEYDTDEKAKTLMVGDTIYDIKGAHHHNIKSVAVNYGFGKKEDLIDSKPSYIVETVDELSNIILGK